VGAVLAAVLVAGCPRRESIRTVPSPGGQVAVTFLDVGQGDAALVRFPDGSEWLVDGGPPGSEDRLRRLVAGPDGTRLRAVVASHPHSDHIGGLVELVRETPPEEALDSGFLHPTPTLREYLRALRERSVRVRRVRAGDAIDHPSGARIEFLAPPSPLLAGTDSDANNNSIVFRLTWGRTRFLFTGDLEGPGRERIYRSRFAEWLPAEVLKVAHHGSRDGTDDEWLRRVRPRIAVISCGAENEYGHPHPETLAALARHGVTVYRTDRDGDITLTSDGERIATRTTGAAPTQGSRPATEGEVIGNRQSRIYHAPECGALPAETNRVPFPSAARAEAAGYRPHAACVER